MAEAQESRRIEPPAGAWWNSASLVVGLGFAAVAVLPGWLTEWSAARALPASPARFVAAYQAIGRAAAVIPAVGLTAAALLSIALFHEGVFRSRRAALRLSAIGALFSLAVLLNAVIEPAAARILASPTPSGEALAAEVGGLRGWFWLARALVAGFALLVAAADRAPLRPPASVSSLGITERHRRVLFLVGTASFFFGYDTMIATLALPYIGRDLGAGEGALGFALAAVKLGALGSVFAGRLADRHGRRGLLLASVIAYTLATGATAWSVGLVDFALYQLVASIFLTTEIVLARVVIAEEFPDSARAHGQAMLGMFTGVGSGVAVVLFPQFLEGSLGWRGMYLVGVLPLLLIAFLRRGLEESRRWQRLGAAARRRGAWRELLSSRHRGLLARFTLLGFATAATLSSAFAFTSHHVVTRLGWAPADVSTLVLVAGLAGFATNFVIGRVSDRIGRRRVAFAGLVGLSAASVLFYQSPWIGPAFALLTMADTSVSVAGAALLTESFPTRVRATAKAWGNAASVVGALAGLAAVGALSETFGGAHVVVPALALLSLAVAPLYFGFEETAHLTIDAIDARDVAATARDVAASARGVGYTSGATGCGEPVYEEACRES